MAKKTRLERISEICCAWREVWGFLQSFPPYRADVKKQDARKLSEVEIRKRWQFYPIGFKKDHGASLALYAALCRALGVDKVMNNHVKLIHPNPDCLSFIRTKKGVFGPNNRFVPSKTLGRKPKKISFEVVSFKDIDVLADEFKLMLSHIYSLHQIRPDRPRTGSSFATRFIVSVCKGLGYDNAKTKDMMRRYFKTEWKYPISMKVIEGYLKDWQDKSAT